ncbi:MAG: substrate-binding domain-containing protein [Bacteroidia bacterium]
MIRNGILLFTLPALLLLHSCGASDSLTQESTTRGSIKIGADDSYHRLVATEIATFESLYKYAKVALHEGPEGEIMDLLMKDSLRAVVISRELTQAEKDYFAANKILPKTTKICTDGLAFVVNKESPDSNLSFSELQNLFKGKENFWMDSKGERTESAVRIVFDSPKSGNARYLRELFDIQEFPAICSAVNSNEEVIEYVEKHKDAIGIIGSNWISDPDDSVSGNFMSRVILAGVSSENDPEGVLGYNKPYQGYLADKSYPFRRDVYIVNREVGTRLATGFASFVAGDKGQRIILKAGLVPAYGVIRLVNVNSGE